MNVLCLGSEVVGAELAAELVRMFLAASFDGGERYVRAAREDRRTGKERCTWLSRDCTSSPRSARASGSTTSRASSLHERRARADDGRGRRHRRHLEPDDLPEGDLAGATPTTSRCATCSTHERRPEGDLLRARRPRRRATRATCCGRSGTRANGARRLRLAGGRPDARVRHRRDDRRGDAPARRWSTGRTST